MKPALILIDLQKGYFKTPEASLALPLLVQKTNRLIDHFDQNHWPVIHLQTIHQTDKSTWTLSMLAKKRGFMLAGTKETEPVEHLKLSGQHTIITKTRDNAFTRTDLEQLLGGQNIDHLILAGVSTHECIAITAMDGYGRDFKVTIAKDCYFSPEPKFAKVTLELLKSVFDQDALSNTSILVRFTATRAKQV